MNKRMLLLCLLLTGCAGMQRDCSSCLATNTGANWVVVQYGFDGTPINCWKLTDIGISNEQATDGIFWDDSGQLIHISGWYNRVQVSGSNFKSAAEAIGVDVNRCTNGKYLSAKNTGTKMPEEVISP